MSGKDKGKALQAKNTAFTQSAQGMQSLIIKNVLCILRGTLRPLREIKLTRNRKFLHFFYFVKQCICFSVNTKNHRS